MTLDDSGMGVLDLGMEGPEDFLDVDLGLVADRLLGDAPQAVVGCWVEQYGREVAAGLDWGAMWPVLGCPGGGGARLTLA